MQVKIQKDSEVRLKIIGTRVDATEIVSLLTSSFVQKTNEKLGLPCLLEFFGIALRVTTICNSW